jgi:folylpolyglutamate synthase/dihydropteroate synthase
VSIRDGSSTRIRSGRASSRNLERARGIATGEDRIVVTGSLYVVGAARAAIP